jgi:hypothetical protein
MGELNKEGARWMEQHKLQGLLRGILSAIAYCHDRRIIHRLSLVIAPVHAAMSRFTLTPAHAKPCTPRATLLLSVLDYVQRLRAEHSHECFLTRNVL